MSTKQSQVMVVSHKETLASKLDSLVGICLYTQHNSSMAYALDLK